MSVFTWHKLNTLHAIVINLASLGNVRGASTAVNFEGTAAVNSEVALKGIDTGMKLRKVNASLGMMTELKPIVTLARMKRVDVSIE